MLVDGVAGVLRVEGGKEVMRHLGYPMYALTIFGVAKILGALALSQNRFTTIKEWAYAGFAINFLGAAASRLLAGDQIGLVLAPLVVLTVMFGLYFLWKKVAQQEKSLPYMDSALPDSSGPVAAVSAHLAHE
jgi:hypothetical protein